MDKPMNRRTKVLQVQNNYNISESDLGEQIVKGLPQSEFEVTTAYLKKKPGESDPKSCAEHSVYFDFKSSEMKGIWRIISLYQIYKVCRAQQFDVVICHRFKPTHIFLLLNLFLDFRRCIGITHGIGDYDRGYRQRAVNRWIKSNWKFVGVSESVRAYLIESCKKLNIQNTVVINNAIDIERAQSVQLDRATAREKLGLEELDFVFGTIGRLVPVKGHKYLVQAAGLLADKYPNLRVVIIGGGREEDALSAQIKEAGLEKAIVLAGWKDDALQYVKAFDVFVLPSLSEGLPISLLEAMSGGRPVIGSSIPSIKPVVEGIGKVCEPKNSESLAECMSYYLSITARELEEAGCLHQTHLRDKYGIDDYRDKYRNLVLS
ncbi:glycosyltransferase [Parendozoicomonas sp. Alg238-R29]|uniref:glycosyltransferase n=1 Tax=Parendozoicomonas sp. Alg238-R29 TaxID=2993446 RepID=UPI00248DC9C4|nr:glycosyltransferase [Parendozoicomonas sp. Alg238-R29]